MIGHLEIIISGGVTALRLKKQSKLGTTHEILTENYNGETIVFSSHMTITSLNKQDEIHCKTLRLTFTPLRSDFYVEAGEDFFTGVFLIPIKQESTVSTAKIIMRSAENFDCSLKKIGSFFDDFYTDQKVMIRLNKQSHTLWNSNIGQVTRGKTFKIQMQGMLIYYESGDIAFSTFFDELQFSFQNSTKALRIKLLVSGYLIQSIKITPTSSSNAIYNYNFKILRDAADDDTSEGTSEGTSDEEEDEMIRVKGFLMKKPKKSKPPAAAAPRVRGARLRPRRRRSPASPRPPSVPRRSADQIRDLSFPQSPRRGRRTSDSVYV